MTGAAQTVPHISLRRDGPFFRVRAVPADALPPTVRQSETYVGYLAASMAAKVLADASGLPIVDTTLSKGASHG